MRKNSYRAVAVATTLIGASLAAFGVAHASIPDSTTGEITACLNGDHAVRIIDAEASATCNTGEDTLSWNVSISGFEVVTTTSASNSSDKQQQAQCPTGKTAIGGGFTLSDPDAAVIVASYPSFPDVWRIDADDRSVSSWTVTTYAICAIA